MRIAPSSNGRAFICTQCMSMTHLGSTFASGLAVFALALSPCEVPQGLHVSFLACCFGCMMTVVSDESESGGQR